MINFDFQGAAIYKAVKLAKNPVFRVLRILKFVSLLLLFAFFALILAGFFADGTLAEHYLLLGFALIFLALSLVFILIGVFFEQKVKKPKLPAIAPSANIAEFLDFEPAKALDSAVDFCKKKNIFPVNTTIFLYFVLKENKDMAFVLYRLLLDSNATMKEQEKRFTPQQFQDTLSQGIYSQKFEQAIEDALKAMQEKGHQRIKKGDMLQALAKHEPVIGGFLLEADLKPKDVENMVSWWDWHREKAIQDKRFWDYENLAKAGSIARSWSAGYSITLDQYSLDWNSRAQREGVAQIFAYENEIEQTESILSSPNINNVLLVGEPGVGMQNIIRAIALKSLKGQSSPQINYQRVLELRIPEMLARLKDPEEVEEILNTVFEEVASSGNIILVINDFHNYVSSTAAPGTIDITGLLASYLNLPQFQVVAVTSYSGLHKRIEENPSIANMFSKVEVREPTINQTIMMLQELVPALESKYKKFISYPAIERVVELTGRYIPNVPFPKKARDALEETVARFASAREQWILPTHIDKLIAAKTEVPVGKLEQKEKEVLLQMEELVHQRIINQEEAVEEVSTALRRARAQLRARKGLMGGFLFLGPTGVGKTETSKALAEIYFNSEKNMIRLDMSEFQSVKDIPRLIGSSGETGLLTTPVRENPFSLVLLDEIEKAHPNILNLFLQVLDEGHITDGLGRKVDFSHTIVICTSNAGYKIILKDLAENMDMENVKKDILDYLFEEAIFRPEFVNRFDAVVLFKPLSKKNLLDIAGLMLGKIKKGLEEKNIEFVITEELKERVVDLGYNITFGARNLHRTIQNNVENSLAEAVLKGEIQKGDVIKVTPNAFKVKVVDKKGI